MNRKELLAARRKAREEIEELNKISFDKMTYEQSKEITKLIKRKLFTYRYYNNLLKGEDECQIRHTR